MQVITRCLLTLFFGLAFTISSFATWSIIIVDPRTGEIGIAGASCTYSVYGIGAIVPGKGAIVVQAMSNGLARAKGIKMIRAGASAEEILKVLKDPQFDPEEQQYAILCINDIANPVTYTGKENPGFKGALTANGVSVQGNTLASDGELRAVLNAVIRAQKDALPMAEVLMRALEAGADLGGDKRCGESKASSAFLTIAKPDDDPKHPSVNLVVRGNDEGVNAVEVLRKKLNNL